MTTSDDARLTLRKFCEAVYCGWAQRRNFDADANGRIAFTLHVLGNGVEEYLPLEFEGVSAFTWRSPTPEAAYDPDDPVEFSAIEVEGQPGAWRVWLSPWDHQEVEFRCARIRLRGVEVVDRGRWLQDTLPAERPRT